MLPKLNRLQKKKDIDLVFKRSRPVTTEYFSFRAAETRRSGQSRFAFVISNKIDKRATRRNSMRRQLRHITRSLIFDIKTGYDVVVIVKKGFAFPYKQEEIRQNFVSGLKKSKLIND